MSKAIWQEADCPNGSDWDLHGDDLVCDGQTIRCIYCGEQHPASIAQTYTVDENGEMRCIDMPATPEALAGLRREFDSGFSAK